MSLMFIVSTVLFLHRVESQTPCGNVFKSCSASKAYQCGSDNLSKQVEDMLDAHPILTSGVKDSIPAFSGNECEVQCEIVGEMDNPDLNQVEGYVESCSIMGKAWLFGFCEDWSEQWVMDNMCEETSAQNMPMMVAFAAVTVLLL